MTIGKTREKILLLPVMRGNYPAELTTSVKARVREACDALKLDTIMPADDQYSQGIIRTNDDIQNYYESWRSDISDIRALIAFSGDFMRERVVQDIARFLPDVPVFLIVNNDDPTDMGKVGDSLCGSLSIHHNMRMLGRRLLRCDRINMHDIDCLKDRLESIARVAAGIESLRHTRVAMLGVNPSEFATTFTNQIKLFELGFSLHTYELLDMWGDVVLGANLNEGKEIHNEVFGTVKLNQPIYANDPRVAQAREQLRQAMPKLPADEKTERIVRCFLWIKDRFEADRIDTGAIHCWGEFHRYFGIAPCAFSMMANLILGKPIVCEVDICHALMARLGWDMSGEAPVILDINNNAWDPRIFNVFHCSQTPSNWLCGPGTVCDYGSIEGGIAPEPFTGISAATSADAMHATVFHGHFLSDPVDPPRGSSGWAYVPNFPEVLAQIEKTGIHHFIALKGTHGRDVADALAFKGIETLNLSEPLPSLSQIEKTIPPMRKELTT